jgi:hypothetical protein
MSREAPAFSVVDVECHAGYRGEETPRRFRLGERQVEVVEVVDSWLAPDHRYFKVKDSQGDLYILRNDAASDPIEDPTCDGLGGSLKDLRHLPTGPATSPPAPRDRRGAKLSAWHVRY